jgi:16S rRNA (guanine527-N7)-methyltransferase
VATVAEQVLRVAGRAGVEVPGPVAGQLAAYIGLLAKWNTTVNLTAVALDPPSDEALVRLLIEPLAASRMIPTHARVVLDVGSGGGSPALPLKLARPDMRFLLVESRARKCAFLREAVRQLNLESVEVVMGRFEDVSIRADVKAAAVDLVTVRAVRIDEGFWESASAVLEPGGHVMLFGTGLALGLPAGWAVSNSIPLPLGSGVATLIGRRTDQGRSRPP